MYKTLKNKIILFSFCILASNMYSQNIAINSSGNVANTAAILDLSDTSNKTLGFLLPNVSLSNVNSASPVSSPPSGLIVYNTNALTTGGFGTGFYYWSGAQWLFVSNSGTPVSAVTSVGLTGPGGIFGITNTNGNPITSSGSLGITTTGISGGIPYFSSTSVLSSSALLTQYGIVLGGGAGNSPAATAALTNGQVLIGSTGVAPVAATLTPAANSGVSITNGAGSVTIGTNGVLNNIITVTYPTTSYTPSAGTQAVQIELIGGGGGGGSTTAPGTNGSAGGGGGSGGYVKFMIANPVGPYTVSIGQGGSGGSAGSGGNAGSATTFSVGATTYSAGGGSGGAEGNASYAVAGGAGGTNSGGSPAISINGNPGGIGVGTGQAGAASGPGGSSVIGGGGASAALTASGGPVTGNAGASNSGSGGSGGVTVGHTNATGGAGANGVIIITEYK